MHLKQLCYYDELDVSHLIDSFCPAQKWLICLSYNAHFLQLLLYLVEWGVNRFECFGCQYILCADCFLSILREIR